MIIGTETLFFAPNLIQWVNCNMGKTWMGAQAVWWLSHRDAKSCSLWSSTKGKCSVNQHCYVSKCAFLQNYAIERCFWGERAKNIDSQGRAATSFISTCECVAWLRGLAISHSSLIPCSWHGKQPAMLTWPAYVELFPSAFEKKKENAKQIKIQQGMQKMPLWKDQLKQFKLCCTVCQCLLHWHTEKVH